MPRIGTIKSNHYLCSHWTNKTAERSMKHEALPCNTVLELEASLEKNCDERKGVYQPNLKYVGEKSSPTTAQTLCRAPRPRQTFLFGSSGGGV
jgi:hypothetical protein